jgi:hypothetical protein
VDAKGAWARDTFEAFSEDARRVLFYARLAVSLIGGSAIDEPHLVVGILIARPDALTRYVDAAHWTEARFEERLRALVTDRPAPASETGTSLASRAEHALRTFMADPGSAVHHDVPFAETDMRLLTTLGAAAQRDHRIVVAEDYVWALTHDPSRPVGALLTEAGVDREAVAAFLRGGDL